jgi:hypothetical protein
MHPEALTVALAEARAEVERLLGADRIDEPIAEWVEASRAIGVLTTRAFLEGALRELDAAEERLADGDVERALTGLERVESTLDALADSDVSWLVEHAGIDLDVDIVGLIPDEEFVVACDNARVRLLGRRRHRALVPRTLLGRSRARRVRPRSRARRRARSPGRPDDDDPHDVAAEAVAA